jgi:steroid 5-alpha reductase family enzyme
MQGCGTFALSAWATHIAAARGHDLSVGAYKRPVFLTIAVTMWSVRLAGFLFYRILQTGTDKYGPHIHIVAIASQQAALIVKWSLQLTRSVDSMTLLAPEAAKPAVAAPAGRCHGVAICVHFWMTCATLRCRRLDPFYSEPGEPWLKGPSIYPIKLLGFWTVQALWEFTVLLPVTAAQAARPRAAMGGWGWVGFGLFLFFWTYEATGSPLTRSSSVDFFLGCH